MVVNQSARKVQLTISGKDYTPCLISFQGSDSHLDQSGLISFTGTIVLGNALDFDESLDDRKNTTRFCRGNTVTLDIADSTGTLRRHPRGTLRILTPKYDLEKQQLTLNVGDLIALLRFKEPVDSVDFDRFLVAGISASGDGSTDYKDPVLDYIAGAGRPLSLIISTLLARTGIYGVGGALPNVIYNNALNLSGSYLESAGKLLYANNCYGWINNGEIFQVAPASIIGSFGGINLVIGKDEIWYKRLDGSESPCEIVKAAGTGVYVYKTQFLDDSDEQYADAGTIDPAFSGRTIVISRTKKIQEWSKSSHTLKITTTTEKPYGLVIPKTLQGSFAPTLSLIIAQIDVETFNYEDKLECKLKSKQTDTYQTRASYFSEYQAAHPNTFANIYAITLTKSVTETYTYDAKDRLQTITALTNEIAISILNGTNEDWTQWNSPPEYLVKSGLKSEMYKEINKGVWEYKTTDFQCVVRVSTDLVTGPNGATSGSDTNKLNLIANTTRNDDKRSNSGQLVPPAPERCPADVRYEEAALKEKAQFATPCPSVLRQRERTYTVDFLAGQTVSVQPGQSTSTALLTTASQQLQAIAQREGRLLWGRYKGQEIAAAMSDTVFNYTPLFPITATEPDGTIQNYLADGANWVVSQQKALWSCDGIWVGTLQGGVVVPPYTEPQEVGAGTGVGIEFISYPYLLTTTTEVVQCGSGMGIQWIGGLSTKIPVGMGQGVQATGSTTNQAYWEDFSWDSADPATWDNLPNSPTWGTASWDNIDWNSVQ